MHKYTHHAPLINSLDQELTLKKKKRLILDLEKSYKDNIENSCVPLTQSPLMLTCYIMYIKYISKLQN